MYGNLLVAWVDSVLVVLDKGSCYRDEATLVYGTDLFSYVLIYCIFMTGTPPLSNKGRPGKMQKKKSKRKDPKNFGCWVVFSYLARGQVGVGTIFCGGYTPSACHDIVIFCNLVYLSLNSKIIGLSPFTRKGTMKQPLTVWQ